MPGRGQVGAGGGKVTAGGGSRSKDRVRAGELCLGFELGHNLVEVIAFAQGEQGAEKE
jgi:hypothetical protein